VLVAEFLLLDIKSKNRARESDIYTVLHIIITLFQKAEKAANE